MPSLSKASSIAKLSLRAQISQSAAVFHGRVRNIQSKWQESPHGREIVTEVDFDVFETFSGVPRTSLTITLTGGSVGTDTLEVAGMPTFQPGEEWVVFLSNEINPLCPLTGWSGGRARVVTDERGRESVELQPTAREELALVPRHNRVAPSTLPIRAYASLIESHLQEVLN